ncbi:MAG TPA: ABC transporter permease subunit [Bryobacteraceae bacterium]|nr:ABC transporter permease subunit [Bryobacteraceae bacterium]
MAGLFTIRRQVSRQTRMALAVAAWASVIAVWFLLTEFELLPPLSLPKPAGVVAAMGRLWVEYDLLENVFMSWWRIAQAFLWCVVVAVPLGVLMASFGWVHDLVNPVAAPMRSMPITAFLPAFIALFGMDEGMKVAFLWFGMFFYLLAVVVEEVRRVDSALLETAYTLGASRANALWLLFRASFPGIFGSFRILYDIGWTYVILAEMVNARKGVGYMVEAARKVLDFERVYAGIIAIGIAAFLFRTLLGFAEKQLFPWRRGAGRPVSEPIAAVAVPAAAGEAGHGR